jgi:hypothetical protein
MHLMRSFVSAVTATTAPKDGVRSTLLNIYYLIKLLFRLVYLILIRHLSFIVLYFAIIYLLLLTLPAKLYY